MFVTDCIVINTGLIFAVSLGIKRRQLLNILTERRILLKQLFIEVEINSNGYNFSKN